MSNFSNSPLVNYTKLSPNCNKPRKQSIDNISIHTMAGNCSVEVCGDIFVNPARKASSNYGIDSSGRVGLYVEECNRSWCTSSAANDHRSITIEVASINNTDYRPSDKAYETLIKLLVDICMRNGIKKLLWKADKSLIGQVDKQNMTVHRWFSNKICCGDWLYNNMGRIADEVNALLDSPKEETPDVVVEIDTEEKLLWEELDNTGLTKIGKAAIMGNTYAESGNRANNLQNSYEEKLKMSDEEYTRKVDSGEYTNFVRDKAGYGYAQWTFWSRKEALYIFAKSMGRSIGDPEMQRKFLVHELTTTYKGMLNLLNRSTSLKEASDIVLTQFEKPADQSDRVKNKRFEYSQNIYNKYVDIISEPSATDKPLVPYLVRVCDKNLRIRKGPSTNTAIMDVIRNNGVFTIVEEAYDEQGRKWGKLKSGLGWIALWLTEKVV